MNYIIKANFTIPIKNNEIFTAIEQRDESRWSFLETKILYLDLNISKVNILIFDVTITIFSGIYNFEKFSGIIKWERETEIQRNNIDSYNCNNVKNCYSRFSPVIDFPQSFMDYTAVYNVFDKQFVE